MRRVLASALLLALVASGTALAGRGDPQREINPTDQARAKSMLLRKSDFVPGFRGAPPGPDSDFYCAAADESDLTLTGDAPSPTFRMGNTLAFIGSHALVYESLADANASWRRSTSPAGVRCLAAAVRYELELPRSARVSVRKTAFPRFADRTAAYRVVVEQGAVRLFYDVVALQRSRAVVVLQMLTSPVAPRRADELEFARVLSERMKTAMRGA